MIGGIGLISCGVVGILRSSTLGTPVLDVVSSLVADVLWACAILVLAFGLNLEASVVARRPLGLTMSSVVAAWPLVNTIGSLISGPIDLEQVGTWSPWGYLSTILPLFAALIAALQVGREQVVPKPWNWVPLWVLIAQVALWVLAQSVGSTAPEILARMPGLLATLGTIGFLAGTLGLGIPAVVLANRPSVGTVEIFRSTTPE